jgi:excisionase family DNA binding protein
MGDDMLVGLENIAAYIGRSRPTTRKMVQESSLPARKLGGRWQSSKKLLDKYIKRQLEGGK